MSEIDVIQDTGLSEGATPIALHHEAPTVPHAANHAIERNRRLASSVLTGLLIKPLGLLAPLITVPLFVHYLGTERYGLFRAIVAMAALLSLSNAGLTMGLVNRLMDCNVSGDRELARRYVTSLLVTLAALMAVALGAWTVISVTVDWGRVFKTTDPRSLRDLPWVVWITGASVFVGLALSLPQSIYQAYQELMVGNLWDGAAKLAAFLASVAVVFTRWGLIGVAVAAAAVQTLLAAVNTVWVFRRKPWLRPRRGCFDGRLVRSLVSDGLLLFLLQMSVVALFHCDSLVIATRINPASVTQYSLLAQLFVSAYALFMVLLMPLWPAHGEAFRRGDWAWIRRGLRLSLAAGMGIGLATGAVLLLFGDPIFRRWTRGEVTRVDPSLVLAMTVMFVLRVWVDCRSVILNSANVLLPQVGFFIAHAVLNLLVALLAVRRFGVAGVAWATPLTALVTTAWGYPWILRRAARDAGR